jgi:hypothetical protein
VLIGFMQLEENARATALDMSTPQTLLFLGLWNVVVLVLL